MRTGLRHKVICIIGAVGGVGKAIAEAFACEGARLALLDVNAAGLEELAAALRLTGTVVNMAVADLRTEQSVQEDILVVLAPYEGTIGQTSARSVRAHSRLYPASRGGKPLPSTASHTSTSAAWRCP